MAYLRCTACGAKALSAATQCPRCTTPFALTDAEGRRVRLTACRGCGYLHRADAACHWCGVLPPPTWQQPAVWRRVAVAALSLVVAGGAWRVGVRDGAPVSVSAGRRPAEAEGIAPGVEPAGTMARTVSNPMAASAPSPVDGASVPSGSEMTASTAASEGAGVRADSVPWVPAVARTWVNVRRDATRDGEVIGVISPDSRAMLGTHRSGWRRVRAADVNGWVDPRLFVADSTGRRGD